MRATISRQVQNSIRTGPMNGWRRRLVRSWSNVADAEASRLAYCRVARRCPALSPDPGVNDRNWRTSIHRDVAVIRAGSEEQARSLASRRSIPRWRRRRPAGRSPVRHSGIIRTRFGPRRFRTSATGRMDRPAFLTVGLRLTRSGIVQHRNRCRSSAQRAVVRQSPASPSGSPRALAVPAGNRPPAGRSSSTPAGSVLGSAPRRTAWLFSPPGPRSAAAWPAPPWTASGAAPRRGPAPRCPQGRRRRTA